METSLLLYFCPPWGLPVPGPHPPIQTLTVPHFTDHITDLLCSTE
jgi:hypothetical protein